MKYRYLEWVVLGLGAVAVLGAVALTAIGGTAAWETIIGELLVLPVLAAAVHWGRNGGFVAAALTLVFFVVLTVVVVAQSSGIRPPMVQLVIVLMIIYGTVGLVGGEICGRMKYLLAGLDGTRALDADTRLYAEPVVRRLVESGLASFHRYSAPFAVVVITVPAGPFGGLKPLQRRLLLRRTADRVRDDVRLVDDVGRLSDGRLVVMLPATQADGARVVARRLAEVVGKSLDTDHDGVGTEVLAVDVDPDAMERFAVALEESTARLPAAVETAA